MISAGAAAPAPDTARADRREAIATVGQSLGSDGSVAGLARFQARILSGVYDASVASDDPPKETSGVAWREVTAPDFAWLRRLAHVPREWAASRRLARAVEAQLSGVPAVAGRTGALAGAVCGGVDGELAEPGGEADRAAALGRALEGVAQGRYRALNPDWLSRDSMSAYPERLLELLARVLAEVRRP